MSSVASSSRDTGRHRGAATGARGVPTRFVREYSSRTSSPEQRWTTAARARDKHDGAYAAANVLHAPVRPGRRRPRAVLPDGILPGLSPRARGARFRSRAGGLRGREASARGASYFFLTSTPALPEGTLLALTANWYVVDAVGGVKPTSVPGSYLTDRM